jgi:hypothetical protein
MGGGICVSASTPTYRSKTKLASYF